MRLLLADENLVVHNRAYIGFPLLIHDDGEVVEPAQTFLWDELAANGRAQSPLTWAKYGCDLYDFFAFLEANELDWRDSPVRGLPNNLDRYRDWSRAELGLNPSTINGRLRLVARFYKWACSEGLIERVPFKTRTVRVTRAPGFLAHVQHDLRTTVALRPTLQQHVPVLRFLSMDQVLACLANLQNVTHRLMFELMVRCGLRQVECRTFPTKYLCNPAKRVDLRGRRTIRLALDPADMTLKYGKPRTIDVPVDLMEDLWWYVVRHRRKRAESSGTTTDQRDALFLTENGSRYGGKRATKALLTKVTADCSGRHSPRR
jgi:site-specific recombinase XerD